MSEDTRIGRAPLTVLLDLRSPACYLALQPARELGRTLGIEIDWLPLSTPPLKAPSFPGPDDDRGVLHRRHRAHAIAREIEVYASAQGLVLRDLYRQPETTAFDLAWLWLRAHDAEHVPAFLLEGFRRYWALELDPSQPAQVLALLTSLGGEASAFAAWSEAEGPAAAKACSEALRERGLVGVPGYLVADEVFQGRQHLPMIRWILGGRVGPGPI